MTRVVLITLTSALAALLGCAQSSDRGNDTAALPIADNSRTSLDWEGVYTGTLPCADCPGIRNRIELRGDGTFSRTVEYIDGDTGPITTTGRFTWDDSGSRITLRAGDQTLRYQVGENVLFQLDRDGQRVTGERAAAYRLEKLVNDPRIENRRWQLIELNGRAPQHDGAYLELDGAAARVAGNASCNRFFGSYELKAGDRLRFGTDIGATMMACPALEQEREFLDMLGRVDNYTLCNGELSLNRARMAPLARFREVR